jgi:5-methylcytosine-specific restriction endonuclease McrA
MTQTDEEKQRKTKLYNQQYYQQKKQDILQQQKEYKQNNIDHFRELKNKSENIRKQRAYESAIQSLCVGIILNIKYWDTFWNKKTEKGNEKSFPYDISAEDGFEMLKKRCFYCGDFATSIDRLDNTLHHTLENCVGCCEFCNISKQATDPLTFILRSVYRRTYIYYEDDDIWYNNKNKPRLDKYKSKVDDQNRPFELTTDQFNKFIVGQCHYCKRQPPTGKFFGIDKVYPDDGYTLDNCVPACASCNRDKWKYTLNEFTLRDERITTRYLEGYFDDLPFIPKHINHNEK